MTLPIYYHCPNCHDLINYDNPIELLNDNDKIVVYSKGETKDGLSKPITLKDWEKKHPWDSTAYNKCQHEIHFVSQEKLELLEQPKK